MIPDPAKPKERVFKAKLTDQDLVDFQAAIAPVAQHEAVAALVHWFTAQPDTIRKDILGLLPSDLRPDIARLLLDRMAKARPARRRP